jgi:hypothetical protein
VLIHFFFFFPWRLPTPVIKACPQCVSQRMTLEGLARQPFMLAFSLLTRVIYWHALTFWCRPLLRGTRLLERKKLIRNNIYNTGALSTRLFSFYPYFSQRWSFYIHKMVGEFPWFTVQYFSVSPRRTRRDLGWRPGAPPLPPPTPARAKCRDDSSKKKIPNLRNETWDIWGKR